MADFSRQDMADAILEAIGAKAAGQSASAEDDVKAKSAYDSVMAKLRQEGLVLFDANVVPPWAQLEITNLVAIELIPAFGVGGERASQIYAMEARSRHELAKQVAVGKAKRPIRAPYF